ncbi:DNA polymerase III subunits gamma and tau [Rubrivivax sp. A210]|uniref:DNA polymerase III subunit gamma/tau n=1 Tax=Rubrivivax sp. A210 TaxID=2772301 RepID=UPI00191ADF4A|nr:DNA polymerase III subunit gamma/tau [Rubrivivax sp. A210]CAD5373962.1 DNA polymerase III subunits gamma and tau [Rubrivivax sp. A210]
MTYVVLARKYRPRTFAQMVGQEHVVQALGHALQQGRLHHAYLFTGTRGIGKTTVSRILAKSLNCTGPDGRGGITDQPCGVCQACTEIDADRYLDYTEMDAASNGGKDEIRDLIERAAYKPGVGRFKVFMIDEAHQLSKDAFNALLKTLEEPPEYLKFVLATTDPEKVLPTVLSRCLQFNLRPMAPATVRDHLQRVLAAENVPFDEGALRLLARAARGSMRDGLSLTDQAIAYGGGQLEEAGVRAMLGSVDRGHAQALVQALSARDGQAVLATVDGLRGLGLSAAATLEELAMLLQQMAIEQSVPGALDALDPDSESARQLAPLLAPDETQLLYSMALNGRAELGLMSDEYAALTMVLLRFLAFAPQGAEAPPRPPREPRAAPLRAPAPPAVRTVSPAVRTVPPAARTVPLPQTAEVQLPVAAPASAPTSAATSTPSFVEPAMAIAAPVAAAPAAVYQVTTAAPEVDTGLGDRWDQLVKKLSAEGTLAALLRELAVQAGLRAIDASQQPSAWVLVVEREPLRNPVLADKLAAVLAQELGQPLQIVLEAGIPADSPARRDAAERQRRQAAAEARIHADPVVRELLAQFKGARIVPGSIKPV